MLSQSVLKRHTKTLLKTFTTSIRVSRAMNSRLTLQLVATVARTGIFMSLPLSKSNFVTVRSMSQRSTRPCLSKTRRTRCTSAQTQQRISTSSTCGSVSSSQPSLMLCSDSFKTSWQMPCACKQSTLSWGG